jgi:hemerythrin-like domain-containing protein
MPHYQSILNHYIWLEQQINEAAISGDKRRNQALREQRDALSSEIEHSQIYENLAYTDSLIRHHAECENQAAYELQEAWNDPGLLNDLNAAAQYHSEKKEEALQEWTELLQQLQQADAADQPGGKQ